MTEMTLYKNPQLLNRDAHRQLKLRATEGYAFAAQTNSVFVAGVEFAQACKHYPIAFTPDAKGQIVPVCVLGLREGQNLFVTEDGAWDANYLPAFVRRYPYALAELAGKQLGVCIDLACEALGSEEGEALFDSGGNASPHLQNAIDFLSQYQTEYTRTLAFCRQLQELDLLMTMDANIQQANGKKLTVSGMLLIDERRLLHMADSEVLKVFRAGELAWIYSHLISVSNLSRLLDRMQMHELQAGSSN